MRKKLIFFGLSVAILVIMFHLFIRPLNWKLNESEVKNIMLNGIQISEGHKSEIVRIYNSMTSVRRRNSFEGSTPTYVCIIELNSGEVIDIQDVSATKLIVGKKKGKSYTSYWTRSSNFNSVAESILLKSK